ncbi:MAG TPA: ferritin family protein [Candidatus Brocadiales bacterium]|nr:ferritin family protein [Candidatus Brocadiales bacterium]
MKWRCRICNYVFEGQEPPLECPVCHAGKYAFEKVDESKTKVIHPGKIPDTLVAKILNQAITKEKEAYNMYLHASRVIKNATAKKLIDKMVEEESKHVSWLENLDKDYLAGVKKTNGLSAIPFLINEEFGENITLQEVVDIAMKREQWAYEFYSSMAKFVDQNEARKLFNNLANEELKHKHEIEKCHGGIVSGNK